MAEERQKNNCEGRVQVWPFKVFPPLKYLIYTPSFHSLHHSRVHTNFCLFMPLYDWLYGTLDPKSWDLFGASPFRSHLSTSTICPASSVSLF